MNIYYDRLYTQKLLRRIGEYYGEIERRQALAVTLLGISKAKSSTLLCNVAAHDIVKMIAHMIVNADSTAEWSDAQQHASKKACK